MDIFNLEHKLRPIYKRPNNIGRSIIYGLLTANIRPIILSLSLSDLSKKNTDFNVVWRFIDRAMPYKAGSAVCKLCLT